MAGLLAYAAAGAIAGFGNALVEQAKRAREDALLALREQQRRGPAAAPARAARPAQEDGERLFDSFKGDDGRIYGRTRDGRIVPYDAPEGVTFPTGRSASPPATGEAPPEVMSTGPTMAAPQIGGDAHPTPQSLEEALGYPSGTVFVDPTTGRLKVRP